MMGLGTVVDSVLCGCGKYDVSRQLEAAPSTLRQTLVLKAA
jgi:hypothetical protein